MEQQSSASLHAHIENSHCKRIRAYAWYVGVTWTLLLLLSSFYDKYELDKTVTNLASTEARAAIDHDILYRSWASSHGGVYAPVTVTSPPNPYLEHIKERDISTPSGKMLTLINPAYMTRQVYELALRNNTAIAIAHLTSLNPIRPENAPDSWEKLALADFERGSREVKEVVQVNGVPHLRLMRAFVTEESCLKCHAGQGYKTGDIRGGLAVSFSIQPLIDATHNQIVGSFAAHGAIWLFGLGLILNGSRKLSRSALEQKRTEMELQEQALRLEEEISERQSAQESLQESEKALHSQNDELQATEEMLRIQLHDYELSQSQLKISNENLRAIFEVSPLPIIISSYESGVIREINTTFCRSFGFTSVDVIGKTSFDIGIWEHITDRQRFLQTTSEHTVNGFASRIRCSSGDVRNIMLYGTIIDFNNERCLLSIIMDTTEHDRVEDELRQTQKMDVIGQLASGVAHDFNNMLTAIMGSAELLQRSVKDQQHAMLLNTICEAARRSADLTGQLLAFSRKGAKVNAQMSINRTVQAAIGLLERTIDKNISLETRLTAANDSVIGDPSLLQNALLNLGINASDAMQEGGKISYSTASVYLDEAYCLSHFDAITPGNYVEISVADNGSGIPKDVIQHIFEPFYTTKEFGKGTGLGLAAVYGTVKEHNGCITVNSEVGVGTVFKLYFPAAQEQLSSDVPVQHRLRGTGSILLVDDEPLIREIGKALLEELGYQVFLAKNGEEALEIFARERHKIALVLLDVIMPVMGGKETLQKLIRDYPDARILMTSGFHHDETESSFIQLGARGLIQKPYLITELVQAIEEVLGNNEVLSVDEQ